jgi:hypothetical protein
VKSIWSKIHPEIELVITEAQLWKAMVKLRCRQLEIPEDSALVDLRGVFFLPKNGYLNQSEWHVQRLWRWFNCSQQDVVG